MQFRKRRKPTYFFVELEVNRVQFSLRLVDISPTGAKLSGDHEVVDGTEGFVKVRGHKVPGTLRWVEGDKVGFEFDTPLPDRLYTTLTHQKNAGSKKRFLMN